MMLITGVLRCTLLLCYTSVCIEKRICTWTLWDDFCFYETYYIKLIPLQFTFYYLKNHHGQFSWPILYSFSSCILSAIIFHYLFMLLCSFSLFKHFLPLKKYAVIEHLFICIYVLYFRSYICYFRKKWQR